MNCAKTKERATNQIQKLQHTKREQITKLHNQNQAAKKPLSQFQIATHKYQRTKPRESLLFSLTLFAIIALCLYRRLESASISKTKKD